jgi:alkylation response protein AidB-like acyl-CoA dehydrogenase
MQLELDAEILAWAAKARHFADEELKRWEIEAEMNGGRIPDAERARHQQLAIELGFSGMSVPREHGGLGLRHGVQVAVWEQLGRITNGLSWCFAEPQGWMFEACNAEQIQRYVLPLMRGERHDCYAITESGSGSEVAIETTARRCPGGYRIDGEKWYVTSANFADFFVLQAVLADGDSAGTHALFFVEADSPGIEIVRTPPFSHTYAAHHPTYRFHEVFVPEANRIGGEGKGMGYMHTWFRRERLMIAARCCGAAARLIDDATAFASTRIVSGEPLIQQQAVQMMLADSVTELWAARLITFETAAAHDRGEDLKHLHTRCSIAKLYASEMANRVADRAVQIFGGRGYMRENVAERFYRELRVERIWEGTSEIQRFIIARGLIKRGLDDM